MHYDDIENVMALVWLGLLAVAGVLILVYWLTDEWAARGTTETGE